MFIRVHTCLLLKQNNCRAKPSQHSRCNYYVHVHVPLPNLLTLSPMYIRDGCSMYCKSDSTAASLRERGREGERRKEGRDEGAGGLRAKEKEGTGKCSMFMCTHMYVCTCMCTCTCTCMCTAMNISLSMAPPLSYRSIPSGILTAHTE